MRKNTLIRLCIYSVILFPLTGFIAGKPTNPEKHFAQLHPAGQVGIASWYGRDHQGKLTASGRPFDAHKLTAAHNTLPLNTKAKIVNLENGKSVEVTINDRGPGIPGRVIDLSERAARRLGMKRAGLALVMIEPLRTTLALN